MARTFADDVALPKKKRIYKTGQYAGVLFFRDIPGRLKAQFKAHCARRGVSMTSKQIEMMKRELREAREAQG